MPSEEPLCFPPKFRIAIQSQPNMTITLTFHDFLPHSFFHISRTDMTCFFAHMFWPCASLFLFLSVDKFPPWLIDALQLIHVFCSSTFFMEPGRRCQCRMVYISAHTTSFATTSACSAPYGGSSDTCVNHSTDIPRLSCFLANESSMGTKKHALMRLEFFGATRGAPNKLFGFGFGGRCNVKQEREGGRPQGAIACRAARYYSTPYHSISYRVFRLSRTLSGLCGPKNFI